MVHVGYSVIFHDKRHSVSALELLFLHSSLEVAHCNDLRYVICEDSEVSVCVWGGGAREGLSNFHNPHFTLKTYFGLLRMLCCHNGMFLLFF